MGEEEKSVCSLENVRREERRRRPRKGPSQRKKKEKGICSPLFCTEQQFLRQEFLFSLSHVCDGFGNFSYTKKYCFIQTRYTFEYNKEAAAKNAPTEKANKHLLNIPRQTESSVIKSPFI